MQMVVILTTDQMTSLRIWVTLGNHTKMNNVKWTTCIYEAKPEDYLTFCEFIIMIHYIIIIQS